MKHIKTFKIFESRLVDDFVKETGMCDGCKVKHLDDTTIFKDMIGTVHADRNKYQYGEWKVAVTWDKLGNNLYEFPISDLEKIDN